MDIEYLLANPKGRLLESYIKKNHPDEYPQILECSGDKWIEKLYNYVYHNPEHKCIVCGCPTKFKSFTSGYYETCSQKCAGTIKVSRAAATIQRKYGVENISQLDSIKEKKKNTLIKNYGSLEQANEHRAQKSRNTYLEQYSSPNAKQKIADKKQTTLIKHYGSLEQANEHRVQKLKQTCLERYGVDNPSKSQKIRLKAQNTCLERYGVDNLFKMKEVFLAGLNVRHKNGSYKVIAQKKSDDAVARNPYVIASINNIYTCECYRKDCNQCSTRQFDIPIPVYHQRRKAGLELCTKINPIGKHLKDTGPENIIKHILNEYGIEYEANTRKIIAPLELDIYIPSKKLAIEINGAYWHSDKYKDKYYHMNKYLACREQGIQLLTFWEDQIYNRLSSVKSILLSKLHIYQHRVFGRKCNIKTITRAQAMDILQNHLQGPGQASTYLGLFYNDMLVSVMSFGAPRKITGGRIGAGEYELIRYCVRPGWDVVGGAGKIMAHFIRQFNPTNIISFSSNDISTGALYKALGFQEVNRTLSYWYIERNTYKRYHRYALRKSELVKMGYDANLTESQIVSQMPIDKIWDAGQTKWVLNIKRDII